MTGQPLTVLAPTRGRPGAARQLDEAFHGTAREPGTYLRLIADEDDPELGRYVQDSQLYQPGTQLLVGPRRRLGPTLNLHAPAVAAGHPGGIVGFMGDDHRPRTVGWDGRVREALAGPPGVAYGDDLFQGEQLATAVFVSAELVRRLGYLVPPGLVHLYLDNFWMELGRATRLVYLPDVVVEHLHPQAGKAAWDNGYAEVNSWERDRDDHAAYDRYLAERWPEERRKLT